MRNETDVPRRAAYALSMATRSSISTIGTRLEYIKDLVEILAHQGHHGEGLANAIILAAAINRELDALKPAEPLLCVESEARSNHAVH